MKTNKNGILIETLSGKHFAITGSFQCSRNDVVAFFERHGCILDAFVTRKTDFILVGEDPGSKLDAAIRKGVKVLRQTEYELAFA